MTSVCADRETRVVFLPYTAPDGQVQFFPDDVLRDFEAVETEAGWLHIVAHASWSSDRVRSYPAHVVSCVHYKREKLRG
jgi:hypothetical protein